MMSQKLTNQQKRAELNERIREIKFAAAVAEPLHRLPPSGLTSGVSLREGVSGVEAIKAICKYYVEKCSGKYNDNVMAARYVHQMADEVLVQLNFVRPGTAIRQEPSVTSKTNLNQSASLRMEELLRDWNENFPQSLGVIGTPKAVAAKIASLTKEIASLKAQAKDAQEKHDKALIDLQHQLEFSRNGVLAERGAVAQILSSKESHISAVLKEERRKFDEKIREVEASAEHKKENFERGYDAKLAQVFSEKKGLQMQVEKLTDEVRKLRLVGRGSRSRDSIGTKQPQSLRRELSTGTIAVKDVESAKRVSPLDEVQSKPLREDDAALPAARACSSPVTSSPARQGLFDDYQRSASLAMESAGSDLHEDLDNQYVSELETNYDEMLHELKVALEQKERQLTSQMERQSSLQKMNESNAEHIDFLNK